MTEAKTQAEHDPAKYWQLSEGGNFIVSGDPCYGPTVPVAIVYRELKCLREQRDEARALLREVEERGIVEEADGLHRCKHCTLTWTVVGGRHDKGCLMPRIRGVLRVQW